MTIQRRVFLTIGATAAAAAAAPAARAAPPDPAARRCKSMLFDATKCIGCRACMAACNEQLGMSPTPDEEGLYDQAVDLGTNSGTVILAYENGDEWSFLKRQCMHCLDPACASACLVKALERTPGGAVVYDENKCIGCRYCMVACPWDVPKFEYEKAVPAIRKCTFCDEHVHTGREPRCVAACPTGALTFGDREALLDEARSRIYDEPDRYVHHIYGEHEAGGTAVLYLSAVPFDEVGLSTDVPTHAYPEFTKAFLNSVPLVILLWAGFCTGLHWFAHRRSQVVEAPAAATQAVPTVANACDAEEGES